MVRCHYCGTDEQMPYRCTYCGKPHCSDHRLPEAHMCPEKSKAAQARRQRELEGHPGVEIRGPGARASGSAKTGTWWERSLGRFEGTTALWLLGVMVVTFIAELLVQGNAGPGAFERLFVLDASWPSKPWTLVTSVFAHGSLNHLLINGIVLFFFGPLLEKRIGSRRFLGLVMAGGILAGLGQVTFYSTFLGEGSGVVGISGALLAVMGTLTVLGPRLTVLIMFIIPAPLWALTIGYAAFDMLGFVAGLYGSEGNIAHLAHLTGLALGLVVGKKLRDQGFKFPGKSGHVGAGPRMGSRGGW